jgi:hypothetical protein
MGCHLPGTAVAFDFMPTKPYFVIKIFLNQFNLVTIKATVAKGRPGKMDFAAAGRRKFH